MLFGKKTKDTPTVTRASSVAGQGAPTSGEDNGDLLQVTTAGSDDEWLVLKGDLPDDDKNKKQDDDNGKTNKDREDPSLNEIHSTLGSFGAIPPDVAKQILGIKESTAELTVPGPYNRRMFFSCHDKIMDMFENLSGCFRHSNEIWKLVVAFCFLSGIISKHILCPCNETVPEKITQEKVPVPVPVPSIAVQNFEPMEKAYPRPNYANFLATQGITVEAPRVRPDYPSSEYPLPSDRELAYPVSDYQTFVAAQVPRPSVAKADTGVRSLERRVAELEAVNKAYIQKLSQMASDLGNWRALASSCDNRLKEVTESRDALQQKIRENRRVADYAVNNSCGMKGSSSSSSNHSNNNNIKKPMTSVLVAHDIKHYYQNATTPDLAMMSLISVDVDSRSCSSSQGTNANGCKRSNSVRMTRKSSAERKKDTNDILNWILNRKPVNSSIEKEWKNMDEAIPRKKGQTPSARAIEIESSLFRCHACPASSCSDPRTFSFCNLAPVGTTALTTTA